LDWVFAQTPRAIILEDDCVPHPTFFRYCDELLDRYQDHPDVQMISGSNVLGRGTPYSYHFSRGYNIWGWATWARAWQHYDEAEAMTFPLKHPPTLEVAQDMDHAMWDVACRRAFPATHARRWHRIREFASRAREAIR
jgi:hypothetical protein